MTTKENIEKYLESQPLFRERRNKDAGIANLLMKKYPVIEHVTRTTIVAMLQDYASMDRAWRQALEHHPELRGKDYEEKVALEEKKQLELGYNPGQKPLIE